MNNGTNSRRGWTRAAVTAAASVALVLGAAVAQEGAQAQQQEPTRAPQPDFRYYSVAPEFSYYSVAPQAAGSGGSEASQVPQDVRIMQRIVRTALSEVEPPELPEVLRSSADDDDPRRGRVVSVGGDASSVIYVSPSGRRGFSVGSSDVTGFYMQGYGYLFTVESHVRHRSRLFALESSVRAAELEMLAVQARSSAAEREADEARASGDAEVALEHERQRIEDQQAAWDDWSAAYRDRLAEALQGVVAQYGSTLTRATPDESITFIADFGGGDEETVTLSARRGELVGAGREQNLSAVQMSVGGPTVSDSQRTELRIMEEIIDSSLQAGSSDDVWVAYVGRDGAFSSGDSSYQFVPGYGVLFRKSARLNVASNIVARAATTRAEQEVLATTLRQRINESTEEQTEAYREHLANLKQATAEILATYGPTLTQMNDNDWVGIFYSVGSAAGLLEGGMSDYLVQARMADIRAAAGEAANLTDQLVTNERQD